MTVTDTFFPFFASCRASARFSDSSSGLQMSGATMLRLPATRVRVGDCFAVLPIALFDALPFFFVSDCRRLPVLRALLALGMAHLSVGS